jgi:hypothetical protein
MTLVVGIVHTFHSLTVDADRSAGMVKGAHIRVLAPVGKAVAAGLPAGVRMLASHHDITLAAAIVLIIAAVLHTTF